MSRAVAELDYAGVVKRAFRIATRPQNLLVLFLGAAIVVLGSIFSAFLLAGPLGVGYADACVRMARGKRAELDDIFWRGFERLKPAVVAGIILGPATMVASFVLLVPGPVMLALSGLAYLRLATSDEELSGIEVLKHTQTFVLNHPKELAIMALIVAVVGAVLCLTVVGSVVAVAFTYLAATLTYAHYFPERLELPAPAAPVASAA